MNATLDFDAVSRRFGAVWALRDVSLRCAPGTITCLVGPNGAGKSTALGVATGLLPPSAGRITRGDGTAGVVGYLPQKSVFPAVLRAGEVFDFTVRAAGAPANARDEIAALGGLAAVLRQPVGELSGGWVRRLGLACALVPPADLVVLDEPFVGLDPETLDRLVAHLERRAAAGTVVLLSTHDFEAADRLRPELVVLDEGRIVQSSPSGQTAARALYRTALQREPASRETANAR